MNAGAPPDPATVAAELTRLTAPGVIVTDAAAIEPLLTDHRSLYHGRALALALPRSTEDVSRILAWCNAHGIGVVPQGGNTSYCGGATPDASGRQLLLGLRRMNRVRNVDPVEYTMTVEAGCVLAQVQAAATAAGRYLPLSLGSEGSCQIGGNLATNAGGTTVVRYGMARALVLGLEVVLPDGRVLDGLTRLHKDNTGYDIRALFLGSEGTLGVITAASLRLFPQPLAIGTAFAAVPGVAAAVALLADLRERTGDLVSSFELLPDVAVRMTAANVSGVSAPLAGTSPWYVLVEITSARAAEPVERLLEDALAAAHAQGLVTDAVIAQSGPQRDAFWKLRESVPEAQGRVGKSLKHDIAVPVGRLAEFVERAAAWIDANVQGATLVAYGHVGDGNLHFNLSQQPGADTAAFVAQAEPVRRAIHDLVRDCAGSFSAEHGIGQLKVGELERYAQPLELELMRAVKHAFDPRGIMNPGKVLAREPAPRL
jgi:D-lactate dehydrogenase (cytochrome)